MVIWGGPGGAQDIITRSLCKVAEKELGQPIICENKTGASGTIGINYVVRSKPDGYTLGCTTTSTYIASPHLYKLPYDVLKDTVDIIAFGKAVHALCTKTDGPWKTYEEIVAFAKENPGKFTYGNPGAGTVQNISLQYLAIKEGFKWTGIPHKSNMESVAVCLGGHINSALGGPVDVNEFVKEGKLRLIMVLDDVRWREFPNIPTIIEKGCEFFTPSRYSLFGPKDLPENIRRNLENIFRNAVRDPSFVKFAESFQMDLPILGGKEYSDLWRSRYDAMGKVIKTLGLGEK
jgi:tripartite-type tricarboxylate transporter receptor subunit TctC